MPRKAAEPGEGQAHVEPTGWWCSPPPAWTFSTSNSSLVSPQRRNPHEGVYNVSTGGAGPSERVGRSELGGVLKASPLWSPWPQDACSSVIGSPELASCPPA